MQACLQPDTARGNEQDSRPGLEMSSAAAVATAVHARPMSERYTWFVLGILTLAQTCHGIDRAIIGLVLEPVGREFGFLGPRRAVPPLPGDGSGHHRSRTRAGRARIRLVGPRARSPRGTRLRPGIFRSRN